MAPQLVVATRSPHKLRELRELLALDHAELISLDDAGVDGEPDETGQTFEANARLKARFYARRSMLPTLADDSGLEVETLGGRPGVRTRRYAGPYATDAENNAKLLRELAGRPPLERTARYVCVLALALPSDGGTRGGLPIREARGTFRGRIAAEPRGIGGFGYDPIFEPSWVRPGELTVAEMTAAEKNRVSHRARAAQRMAPILRELGF